MSILTVEISWHGDGGRVKHTCSRLQAPGTGLWALTEPKTEDYANGLINTARV